MHSIEENPTTEASMAVDHTADEFHIYGNGVDVGINKDAISLGFEESVGASFSKLKKQLILRLPVPDNGESLGEGALTFYLDPENHAIVFRAWLPGEGIWKTTLELSPENS